MHIFPGYSEWRSRQINMCQVFTSPLPPFKGGFFMPFPERAKGFFIPLLREGQGGYIPPLRGTRGVFAGLRFWLQGLQFYSSLF